MSFSQSQQVFPSQNTFFPLHHIVLIGMMGAGKTTIGRYLARRLNYPFIDSDHEIEHEMGCSIADIFRLYGESTFREKEHEVIQRLLKDTTPKVIATGGGAFMDARTRTAIHKRAISFWIRCPLSVIVRRVKKHTHRPLVNTKSPYRILKKLLALREPVYTQADIIIDCGKKEDTVENVTTRMIEALEKTERPLRLPITLSNTRYDVLIGHDLISKAGSFLAPILPSKAVVIITDETVKNFYLDPLKAALTHAGIKTRSISIPAGEQSKNITTYTALVETLLKEGIERCTSIIALGGGVVGDLAGFIASTTLRGLPFIQIPTTLLAQVDSSVGGKTGINTRFGKNLIGTFHQPLCVIADTSTLSTLHPRQIKAGYAEIVKAGLIGDAALFVWCEKNGKLILEQNQRALTEAVQRACAFKAHIVATDEKEKLNTNGRALLNLGHTFAHALEAEFGYDDRLLHGEAVSIGLNLAFALSVRLGLCPSSDWARVTHHLETLSMPTHIRDLPYTPNSENLIIHMHKDKKIREGQLSFVLVRGIGQAFTSRDIPIQSVIETLRADGAL